ncbi:MAG: hypothetical protein ACRDMX_11725 [Solirubrobacteraceae bacterium]
MRRPVRRPTAVTLAAIAVIVALAALAQTSTGLSVTRSLGLRGTPEPYTALSFAKPADAALAGVSYHGRRVRDRLAFAITNHERGRTVYRWTISFSPATRTYRGSISVPAGATRTVTASVKLPCGIRQRATRQYAIPGSPTRAQVRVALDPSGDTIDFWRSCGG